MPFSSNSDLPKAVRNALPAKALSQFRAVVNSVLEEGHDEARAFASAWSVIRRKWKKEDGKWVAKLGERQLEFFDEEHSKIPFEYEGNVLGTLREDQVPRFFGALTDADKLPTRQIKFSDLVAMQNRVKNEKVEAMRSEVTKAGNHPVVVRHDGKFYLADGHHRAVAEWLDGAEELTVHYKDIEEVSNMVKADTIIKVDESLGLVFGWAIVCKVDGEEYYDVQEDHIPEHSMLKATADFMINSRVAKEMHVGEEKGSVVFAWPMTAEIAKAMGITTKYTGLMIAMKPDSKEILEKFKDGTYTGFSIGGQRLVDTAV